MKRKVWMMIEKELDETEVEQQKTELESKGFKVAVKQEEIEREHRQFQNEQMNQHNQWALEETLKKWLAVASIDIKKDLKVTVEVEHGETQDELYLKSIKLEDQEIERKIVEWFDEEELMYVRRTALDRWDLEGFLNKQEYVLKKETLKGVKREAHTNEEFTAKFGQIKNFQRTLENWAGGKYSAYLVNKSGNQLAFQLFPDYSTDGKEGVVMVVFGGERGKIQVISRNGLEEILFQELVSLLLNAETENKIKNLF